jgi:hypothetical protein
MPFNQTTLAIIALINSFAWWASEITSKFRPQKQRDVGHEDELV